MSVVPRVEILARLGAAGPSLDQFVVTTAASDDGTGGDLFVCDVGIAGNPTIAFAG
jgi:hypothetical protein